MSKADIGLIGLAVMGENLVLNMESHGFTVAVYNRTTSKVDDFINGRGRGKKLIGSHSIAEFCEQLQRPRRIMLLVKAGSAVDELIQAIVPYLSPGDILIDGGNTHFPDTERRMRALEAQGLLYIGTGVSGGEEGALNGPSIMPGGSPAAWPQVKPILQAISAKVAGVPCCDWVGSGGAGHFVKMVHNGIEYGDMQLICEAYHFLKDLVGLNNAEMHQVFAEWNQGELNSYLIEITRDILAHKDQISGGYVVDNILDTAGQKGTGKWTTSTALDLGVPVTLIGEAVFARFLSAIKDERSAASKILPGPKVKRPIDRAAICASLREALYVSKLVSYAQGFAMMRQAAKEYGWKLNYGPIALLWRGGCIIRSTFLGQIKEAFDRNPDLSNLLLDPFFKEVVAKSQCGWRKVVAHAVESGIPLPAMSSALAYFDGYRCERLPANLLQAQRDYFGAHTYERLDQPRGQFFHTNWSGHGGSTVSTTYTA